MKNIGFLLGFLVAVVSYDSAFAQCETMFGLVINEIMPANSSTASDEYGEFDDWVEIYNGTGNALNIGGYFLSDNHGNRTKYTFPDHVMQHGDYVIVWCDNQPEQGIWHADFALSASGEEIGLYNPDTVSVDYQRFGPVATNISRGRYPNGSGPFKILIPTFDGPNVNSVDPGVVINEYQSVNESTAQDQWGGFDDWIELYNNSANPIDLTGYFLSDKIGTPTLFAFPDTVLQPDDYIIVWCDNGLFEPGLHANFKLGSEGDDIIFSDPDTNTVDYVRFGIITPDETEGRYPNGTGPFTCMLPSFSANNGSPDGLVEPMAFRPLRFYPNPATNEIRIVGGEGILPPIHVYDMAGRMVQTGKPAGEDYLMNVSGLSPGIYVVVADDRRGKLVIR